MPNHHYPWLALLAGLALFSVVSRAGIRARRRARAAREVERVRPLVERLAREAGFEAYAITWLDGDPLVTLEMWGACGGYAATCAGRDRGQALRAALGNILQDLAEASPDPAGEPGPAPEPEARAAPDAGPQAPRPDWWRRELGLEPGAGRAEAERAFRTLAKSAHPDKGGSAERMARLNAARDEARRVLGRGGFVTGAV